MVNITVCASYITRSNRFPPGWDRVKADKHGKHACVFRIRTEKKNMLGDKTTSVNVVVVVRWWNLVNFES